MKNVQGTGSSHGRLGSRYLEAGGNSTHKAPASLSREKNIIRLTASAGWRESGWDVLQIQKEKDKSLPANIRALPATIHSRNRNSKSC